MAEPTAQPPPPEVGAATRRDLWVRIAWLLLIASAFRFYALGKQDLWLDEVWAYEASTSLVTNLFNWDVLYDPIASPLPWLEAKVVRHVVGKSDLAVRLPSAIYGVAAVALFYALLRRMTDEGVALAAALVLALDPFAIDWAREGRMYSHWLFFAMLMALIAWSAFHRVRDGKANALDWRWWLLGIVFMLTHAVNVHGVMTIGAVGLWLGVVGLIEMRRCGKAGLHVLLGAALSAGVYLSSWALTGIGRLIRTSSGATTAHGVTVEGFVASIRQIAVEQAGTVPEPVAWALWAVALVGLAALARRGCWRGVLAIVLVGTINWVGYRSMASRHFFTSRYVLPGELMFCLGLGASASAAWRVAVRRGLVARCAFAAAAIALALLWLPSWHEVITVPKQRLRTALAPIQQHADAGELVAIVPEFYFCLDDYYGFGKGTRLMLPPKQARSMRWALQSDPSLWPEPIDADYEVLFASADRGDTEMPKSLWLFVVEPDQNLAGLNPLLERYGLGAGLQRDALNQLARGAATLTVRIRPAGYEHAVTTTTRRNDWTGRLQRLLEREP